MKKRLAKDLGSMQARLEHLALYEDLAAFGRVRGPAFNAWCDRCRERKAVFVWGAYIQNGRDFTERPVCLECTDELVEFKRAGGWPR